MIPTTLWLGLDEEEVRKLAHELGLDRKGVKRTYVKPHERVVDGHTEHVDGYWRDDNDGMGDRRGGTLDPVEGADFNPIIARWEYWLNGLKPDEKHALTTYRDDSRRINTALRRDNGFTYDLPAKQKDRVRALDDAFKSAPQTQEDMYLYRGMRDAFLEFAKPGDTITDQAYMSMGSHILAAAFAGVGEGYEDLNEYLGPVKNPTMLRIKVPKGSQLGLAEGEGSPEPEFIAPRKSKIVVKKIGKGKSMFGESYTVIDAELEDPYAGYHKQIMWKRIYVRAHERGDEHVDAYWRDAPDLPQLVRPSLELWAQDIRNQPGNGPRNTRWLQEIGTWEQTTGSDVVPGYRYRFPNSPTKYGQIPQIFIRNDEQKNPDDEGNLHLRYVGDEDVVVKHDDPVERWHVQPGYRDALQWQAERAGFNTIEEYDAWTAQKLRDLTSPESGAKLAVRVDAANIPAILKTGRLTTIHDPTALSGAGIGGWGGKEENADRAAMAKSRDWEDKVWMIPDDAPPWMHPIYGYVGTDKEAIANAAVNAFGDVKLTLKDSVRPRTTMTYGDSHGIGGTAGTLENPQVPAPVDHPSPLMISPIYDLLGTDKVIDEGQPRIDPPLEPEDRVKLREIAGFALRSEYDDWLEHNDEIKSRLSKLDDAGLLKVANDARYARDDKLDNNWMKQAQNQAYTVLGRIEERAELQGWSPWHHGTYIETQTLGGILTSDITKAEFPSEPAKAIQNELEKQGIEWSVYGPKLGTEDRKSVKTADVPFVESEHPRDTGGRFAEKFDVLDWAKKLDVNAHVVGGAVRDELLGRPIKDYDFMTPGVPVYLLREKLSEYGPVEDLDVGGRTVGFRAWPRGGPKEGIEFAPPRKEISTGPGRQDFDIVADPDAPIEVDALRRDFTINALYKDIGENKIIDPLGGVEDLNNRLLRTTSDESFRDDPLRILRGLRFMSNLDFNLHPDTRAQMIEHADAVHEVSGERIGGGIQGSKGELTRMLEGVGVARALREARDTGVLKQFLPELEPTFGFDQESQYHNMTADEHIIRVVQAAQQMGASDEVLLAALLHDSGKPESAWRGPEGNQHFYANPQLGKDAHEEISARKAMTTMTRLKYPNDVRDKVVRLVEAHMFQTHKNPTPAKARRFLAKYGDDAWDLLDLKRADIIGKTEQQVTPEQKTELTKVDRFEEMLQVASGEPHRLKDLAVNGGDLIAAGYQPGPKMGRLLGYLLNEVIGSPKLNNREWLLAAAERWWDANE